MKTLNICLIAVFIYFPFYSYSQINAADLLGGLKMASDVVKQDTAKPKTGTTSNLAVSDSGASSKSESKKAVQNPIKQFQKNITKSAIGNNAGSATGNLAVGDEGAPADKEKKEKKKK